MRKTYANRKAELRIAKINLEYLMQKKEELYAKYFPVTARFKDTVAHTNQQNDSMADYVEELTRINPVTLMSLEEEIEQERNNIQKLQYYINLIEYQLENTTGIENELFKLIAVKGMSKTKAVEKVAEKYHKEPRTIWEYNYSQIKNELKKIEGDY